jgi:hypothetical protein
MSQQSNSTRSRKSTAFRMGRVRVYLRGRVWYLCHYEDGRRHRPRVGPDRDVARQMVLRSRKESICLVRCRSASWTKARPVHLASRDCARMCRVEQAAGATGRTTLLSIPLYALLLAGFRSGWVALVLGALLYSAFIRLLAPVQEQLRVFDVERTLVRSGGINSALRNCSWTATRRQQTATSSTSRAPPRPGSSTSPRPAFP